MRQEFEKYTKDDLEVWGTLFTRQFENLQDKASSEYINALHRMKEVINPSEMPNFEKINHWFGSHTGWEIECVPGLIEVDEFFCLLADKKFPSSTWLRSMDKLDYLEEPDMFHDIFGHVPLLSNPEYSNFVHQFGQLGKEFINDEIRLKELQRLYWFTIEFGLIKEEKLSIYGAGILSSYGETNRALNPNICIHKCFDLKEIMQKDFVTSEVQETYFSLLDLNELVESVEKIKRNWELEENANLV